MGEVFALQSMFDGLYVQALRPTGRFRDRLREKGFDLDKQKSSYPMSVWVDCLDVTSEELHPTLTRALAWRAIGRQFIDGYFQTLVGRMIGSMLPFLSPSRFTKRVPGFITTGLQGAKVGLTWEGEKRAILIISGVHQLASCVMAGVLEGSFSRMKVAVTLEPRALPGLDSELVITLP